MFTIMFAEWSRALWLAAFRHQKAMDHKYLWIFFATKTNRIIINKL